MNNIFLMQRVAVHMKPQWKMHAVYRLATAWILSAITVLLALRPACRFNTLDFMRGISLTQFMLLMLAFFVILSIIHFCTRSDDLEEFFPAYAALLYLFLILLFDPSLGLALGIGGLLALSAFFFYPRMFLCFTQRETRPWILVLCGFIIVPAGLVLFRIIQSATSPVFYKQHEDAISFFILFLVSLLIGLFVAYYRVKRQYSGYSLNISSKTTISAVVLFGAIYLAIVGGILFLRYWSLITATYDFGLFSQMFHYMKETGQPLTTLERNGLLSHFSVHFSPIYYILLPVYLVWPNPAVLQLMQPAVVIFGLIPIYLLTRHWRMTSGWRILAAAIYAFNIGVAGGSVYDLHENCFLAPLLLWALYFLEKEKWLLMYAASVLVLTVKEDAVIYVAAVAVYLVLSEKKWKLGTGLFMMAAAWFLIASALLRAQGEGPMIWRYANYMANPSLGLPGVIATIFVNPGYLLSQIFIEKKLVYILRMLLSVGFLPVLTRRLTDWILFAPMLVINLMSNWPYQFEIGFQYHYGTSALLIYLFLHQIAKLPESRVDAGNDGLSSLNIRDGIQHPSLIKCCAAIALISAVICCAQLVRTYTTVAQGYINNRTSIQTIKAALDTIPADAGVQATSRLTSYLSRREIVYDVEYNLKEDVPFETEYVAFDLRKDEPAKYDTLISRFTAQGYKEHVMIPDCILILRNSGG